MMLNCNNNTSNNSNSNNSSKDGEKEKGGPVVNICNVWSSNLEEVFFTFHTQ